MSKPLSFSKQWALGAIACFIPVAGLGAGSFDFDDGTVQGWTLDQMYVTATQVKFTPVLGYTLGNSGNQLSISTSALLIGKLDQNDVYLESPDVSSDASWQTVGGFSVDVRRLIISPCGEPLNAWFVQLQAKVIDTSDGNKEKLFAEWNGNWVFHTINYNQPYHLTWSGWPLSDPKYKIKTLRLRVTGPGDYGPECWCIGSWTFDNIQPVPTQGSAVSVAATDAAAGEPATGQGTGTFTFTRSGDVSSALTVDFTVAGTASSGADYTSIGTSASFNAGSATTTKTVTVKDDGALEGNETVLVTLSSGTGYTVGTPSSATVTIADDDALVPAHDACGGAIPLSEDVYSFVNTTSATDDGSSTCLGRTRTKGVWYSYTPARTGTAAVDTCTSDFDTNVEVFTGGCGGLTSIACNEDSGVCSGYWQAAVTFPCTAGTTYLVYVGGYNGQAGVLQTRAYLLPVNDTCAGAITLNDNVYYTQSTAKATDDGDSICLGRMKTKGLWFAYTPLVAGTVTVDTCPSDFDTNIEVFTGPCGALSSVGCNEDSSSCAGSWQASFSFTCTPGTTYVIYAGGYNGQSGNLQIRAALAPTVPTPTFAPIDPNASPMTLTLQWQGSGYVLEESSGIPTWSNSDAVVSCVAEACQATDSTMGSIRFYRLRDNSVSPSVFGSPVGYVALSLPGGWSGTSNPFQRLPGANKLNDLFKLSDQHIWTVIFRWDTATSAWVWSVYLGNALGWWPNLELPLGEGVALGTAGGLPLTAHMAGPFPLSHPAIRTPAGFAIVAPPWPISQDLTGVSYPVCDWDWVFTLDNATGTYFGYFCFGAIWWPWDFSPPAGIPLSLCESFWSWRAAPVDWVCGCPASLP